MKKIKSFIILTLLLSTFFVTAQDSKNILLKTLTDTSLKTRGIIQPDGNDFRLDFDDVYESDSHAKFLQSIKHHGGGPSWIGIIYGAFTICENNLIETLDSDVSVTGVSYWSSKKEDLEMIGRIIHAIKSDKKILLDAIEIAKQKDMML